MILVPCVVHLPMLVAERFDSVECLILPRHHCRYRMDRKKVLLVLLVVLGAVLLVDVPGS